MKKITSSWDNVEKEFYLGTLITHRNKLDVAEYFTFPSGSVVRTQWVKCIS